MDELNLKTFIAGAGITRNFYEFTVDANTGSLLNAAIELEFYDSINDTAADLRLIIGSGLVRDVNALDRQTGEIVITAEQVDVLLAGRSSVVIGYVWTITPVGAEPVRMAGGTGYNGSFTIVKESSVVGLVPATPLWQGTYTDSNAIARNLGGRILIPGYVGNQVFGWSGPLITAQLLIQLGTQVESEIDALLGASGHALPLKFAVAATQGLLQGIATKAIICELFRAVPTSRQNTGDIGEEDLEAIEALVEDDYCTAIKRLEQQLAKGLLQGEESIVPQAAHWSVSVSGSRRDEQETNVKAESIFW